VVFTSGPEALDEILARGPDVVVTDWRMEGLDGLELLRIIHESRPATPVILVTAYGDVPSAVAAMRAGAFDYVTKPFDNDELRNLVERALELRRLRHENLELRREILGSRDAEVVAESEAMKKVLDLVGRALFAGTGPDPGRERRGRRSWRGACTSEATASPAPSSP
jgi:two-component system response regulator HydG